MIPFIAEHILGLDGTTQALEILIRPPNASPEAFLKNLGSHRDVFIERHLQHALRTIHAHFCSLGTPCPTMHINAASCELHGLTRHLRGTVISCGLTPDQITVELTEWTPHLNALNALKRDGFSLALDDIGREPFHELTHHPLFSTVKTDRVLINQPEDLQRLVTEHRRAGRRVIVEGIETPEHHHVARTLQADGTQGYYHYPPLALSTAPVRAAG